MSLPNGTVEHDSENDNSEKCKCGSSNIIIVHGGLVCFNCHRIILTDSDCSHSFKDMYFSHWTTNEESVPKGRGILSKNNGVVTLAPPFEPADDGSLSVTTVFFWTCPNFGCPYTLMTCYD